MKRADLEHVLRAASAITNQRDFIVIGSQSVLGQFPDAPAELLVSDEVDIYPRDRPDLADLIDGAMGELSFFHDEFGYYAQGVGPTTAILPAGWEERLIIITNDNTVGRRLRLLGRDGVAGRRSARTLPSPAWAIPRHPQRSRSFPRTCAPARASLPKAVPRQDAPTSSTGCASPSAVTRTPPWTRPSQSRTRSMRPCSSTTPCRSATLSPPTAITRSSSKAPATSRARSNAAGSRMPSTWSGPGLEEPSCGSSPKRPRSWSPRTRPSRRSPGGRADSRPTSPPAVCPSSRSMHPASCPCRWSRSVTIAPTRSAERHAGSPPRRSRVRGETWSRCAKLRSRSCPSCRSPLTSSTIEPSRASWQSARSTTVSAPCEAAETSGAGADKFLDELLVWREIAWHYAAHTPELESLDALPDWARATLAAHAPDAREVLSMERLERGRTGDVLWDFAQRSLVAHGELHNNVRMTWGKAVPSWTATPEDARRALVTLNNRYALDGRDPSSYGGLYWCLGLFVRPFTPEQCVLGSVRARPTSVHAARLDIASYAARGLRDTRRLGRVAVVGSGVAGLACARTLHDHGVDVVVFDKGRAPGGRLASRRTPELVVDLGAQYFTARDERFRRFVNSWVDDGLVALWTGRVRAVDGRGGDAVDTAAVERFVGTPSMNAIARHFARELAVRVSQRVDRVERLGRGFVLHGTVGQDGTTLGPRDVSKDEPPEELGTFDALALCIPPAQACELLDGVSASLAAASAQVTFDPCVAFGFVPEEADALRAIPFDGLFVGRDGDPDRILAWVARDSSKPMRPDGEAWVVHASPEWSRAHLREPREALERTLLEEVARVLRLEGLRARSSALQRWAFARAPSPLERPLFDDDARAGVGGDWTAGGRVEGAFLSGVALAGRVLGLTCT